jgi:hypothetical protein
VPTNWWPAVVSEIRKVTQCEIITESKEQKTTKYPKFFFVIWCDSLIIFDKHLNHTIISLML